MILRDLERVPHLRSCKWLYEDMTRVVEFYCAQYKVTYCQGMLDVLLPFMFMKNKTETSPDSFDLACVYAYFKKFIAQFIPNNLHTKACGNKMALPYIKCTLSLIETLLAYADREVFCHLKRRKVVVETYGAGWVTTVFSRTVDFTMIYELWEVFLFERDSYFLLYFAVGLIIHNRDRILATTQFDKLITLMMSLRIESLADLLKIYKRAIEVR
jgi:hypothetical protein